jgi:hypothetical protein
MPPLRRRYLVLTGLLACLTLLVVVATTLWAEGTMGVATVDSPVFAVLSLLSLPALAGVLVQWGATRERMKDIGALRGEVTTQLREVNRRLDTLFELLGVNRRGLDRMRFGERAGSQDDGA